MILVSSVSFLQHGWADSSFQKTARMRWSFSETRARTEGNIRHQNWTRSAKNIHAYTISRTYTLFFLQSVLAKIAFKICQNQKDGSHIQKTFILDENPFVLAASSEWLGEKWSPGRLGETEGEVKQHTSAMLRDMLGSSRFAGGDSESASGNSGFPMDIYLWQFCLWFILIFKEVPTNGQIDWYILSDFDLWDRHDDHDSNDGTLHHFTFLRPSLARSTETSPKVDPVWPCTDQKSGWVALSRRAFEIFEDKGKIGKCDEMCMPVLHQVRKLLGTWHIQLAHFACLASVLQSRPEDLYSNGLNMKCYLNVILIYTLYQYISVLPYHRCAEIWGLCPPTPLCHDCGLGFTSEITPMPSMAPLACTLHMTCDSHCAMLAVQGPIELHVEQVKRSLLISRSKLRPISGWSPAFGLRISDTRWDTSWTPGESPVGSNHGISRLTWIQEANAVVCRMMSHELLRF